MDNFGVYLKRLRKSKRFTVRQLALYSHVSHGYISQIESGKKRRPTPEIIKKLAPSLGVSYEDMMNVAGYISSPSDHSSTRVNIKQIFEEYALRYDDVDLTTEEQELMKQQLQISYTLIKKSRMVCEKKNDY